jgi:hypothetical protein
VSVCVTAYVVDDVCGDTKRRMVSRWSRAGAAGRRRRRAPRR